MDYSDKVLEHFIHPRNVGEIPHPSGESKVGNPACGDILWLQIKVENGTIADVKFKTFGCCAAIASGSILTEMVKGKTIEEALKITNRDVVDALGGLPSLKMHCSVLAQQALRSAIENYLKKNG